MENSNRKIDFLRKKKFSEIMGDTYRLLAGHYKLWLKLLWIGLIPAICFSYFLSTYPGLNQYFAVFSSPHASGADFYPPLGLVLLFAFSCGVQLYLFLVPYSFVRYYRDSCEKKQPLFFKEALRRIVKTDLFKGLLVIAVLIIPVIILVPIAFYAYIPLSLVIVSFLLQPISLGDAIKEGFTLGTRYWARTFAGGVAFLFIAGIVSVIFIAPYLVMIFAQHAAYFSVLEGNEVFLPGYFGPLLFVTCVLLEFVVQSLSLFGSVALIFHFFNLKARRAERNSHTG